MIFGMTIALLAGVIGAAVALIYHLSHLDGPASHDAPLIARCATRNVSVNLSHARRSRGNK